MSFLDPYARNRRVSPLLVGRVLVWTAIVAAGWFVWSCVAR